MRETRPTTRLIAGTTVRWPQVESYLREIGGEVWLERVNPTGEAIDRAASDAELLCEYAGRRCYKSWAPGINANVTKVRESSSAYLESILSSKHGAVLEHAQFSFDFDNVSRVFTHELVRHRAGIAISQESLRYVRLSDLGFRVPPILLNGPEIDAEAVSDHDLAIGRKIPMAQAVVSIVERLEDFQRSAAEAFGLDDDGVPFHYKKEVTSALRRLAPIGLSTGMVWSSNIRTLRHVIPLRTHFGAEEEIRLVFNDVANLMKDECPFLFADFEPIYTDETTGTEHEIPWLKPRWEKV